MSRAVRLPQREKDTVRDDELKELFVFGYASKIYRDDIRAEFMDQNRHLIPWMGQPSITIDRYDCRGHLHDLSEWDSENYVRQAQSEEEQRIDLLCDEERYSELYDDVKQRQVYEEEEMKRLNEALNETKHYGAVAFSYASSDGVNTREYDPSQPTDELEEKPFIPWTALAEMLPSYATLPANVKQHRVIEKTAKFISQHGAQMEIVIRAKQASNELFSFMEPCNVHNSYYKCLVSLMKENRFVPAPEEPESVMGPALPPPDYIQDGDGDASADSDDEDDSGYLNPLLMGGYTDKKEPTPPPPAIRSTSNGMECYMLQPVQPPKQPEQPKFVPDISGTPYARLITEARERQRLEVERKKAAAEEVERLRLEAEAAAELAAAEAAAEAAAREEERRLHAEAVQRIKAQEHAAEEEARQIIAQRAIDDARLMAELQQQQAAFQTIAPPGLTPITLPPPAPSVPSHLLNGAAPIGAAGFGAPNGYPQSQAAPYVIPPGSTTPLSSGTLSAPGAAMSGSAVGHHPELGGGSAADGSGADEESDDSDDDSSSGDDSEDGERSAPRKPPPPPPLPRSLRHQTPPSDWIPIIEKMAQYVARNGEDFETAMRVKGDPRYIFLDHEGSYNEFYVRKREDARAQIIDEQKYKPSGANLKFSLKTASSPRVRVTSLKPRDMSAFPDEPLSDEEAHNDAKAPPTKTPPKSLLVPDPTGDCVDEFGRMMRVHQSSRALNLSPKSARANQLTGKVAGGFGTMIVGKSSSDTAIGKPKTSAANGEGDALAAKSGDDILDMFADLEKDASAATAAAAAVTTTNEKYKMTEEQQRREQATRKLMAAARHKLSAFSRSRDVQAERKRRAAAFVSMLAASNDDRTAPGSSAGMEVVDDGQLARVKEEVSQPLDLTCADDQDELELALSSPPQSRSVAKGGGAPSSDRPEGDADESSSRHRKHKKHRSKHKRSRSRSRGADDSDHEQRHSPTGGTSTRHHRKRRHRERSAAVAEIEGEEKEGRKKHKKHKHHSSKRRRRSESGEAGAEQPEEVPSDAPTAEPLAEYIPDEPGGGDANSDEETSATAAVPTCDTRSVILPPPVSEGHHSSRFDADARSVIISSEPSSAVAAPSLPDTRFPPPLDTRFPPPSITTAGNSDTPVDTRFPPPSLDAAIHSNVGGSGFPGPAAVPPPVGGVTGSFVSAAQPTAVPGQIPPSSSAAALPLIDSSVPPPLVVTASSRTVIPPVPPPSLNPFRVSTPSSFAAVQPVPAPVVGVSGVDSSCGETEVKVVSGVPAPSVSSSDADYSDAPHLVSVSSVLHARGESDGVTISASAQPSSSVVVREKRKTEKVATISNGEVEIPVKKKKRKEKKSEKVKASTLVGKKNLLQAQPSIKE